MSIEKRKRDDVEKEDAEDDKNWSGAREGYYFGTNEKGVLGYHLDPLHGNKTSVGRREDVSTKESGSVTTGYLRVKDCISKKDEGKNEPKRPEISRKKMKKLLKMTPDERLLLGFGYLDQKKDDLKIHRHEPSKDEKYSDLAPEVVAVIKAQQSMFFFFFFFFSSSHSSSSFS